MDRKVWSASRRKRRREDNQDRTEKERGVWRPPGKGELALRGERHSRTGMRYALLLL